MSVRKSVPVQFHTFTLSFFFLCSIVLCNHLEAAANSGTPEVLPKTNVGRSSLALPAAYGRIRLTFEANAGQTSGEVKFLTHGPGYTLFLTRAGAVMSFSGASRRLEVRMHLSGAKRSFALEGEDELPGKINYIRGNNPSNWTTNVRGYGAVRYRGVYDGVDLLFRGNNRRLEYDFVLAPGTDERQIALNIDGADSIRVSQDGDLLIRKGDRTIAFQRPIAYEPVAASSANPLRSAQLGTQYRVEAGYVLRRNRVGFWVARRNPHRMLVIDPALNYSTYVGGSGDDYGTNVAVDSSGNAYVAGYTSSVDFPSSVGAFQTGCGGGCVGTYDAYVLKLNATGTALLYSTYLGGSSSDYVYGLFVDSVGQAYLAGETSSVDFPVTTGVYQTTCAGGCATADGFVAELNSSGSGLVYSTYIGGSGKDRVNAVVVDSAGNAYIAGNTQSTNFPITPGVFQTTCSCMRASDAFAAELNPSGSSLVYSSYLGGTLEDVGYAIAIDQAGDSFLTGYTRSLDFPVTAGAFQTALNAPVGAFVTKISPGGASMIYSTYLGGSNTDTKRVCHACGTSILVDANGNALVAGLTLEKDFPTTQGAYQTVLKGTTFGHDAFLTNLNSSGTALLYSTFLGGQSDDGATAIAADSGGNIYVRGNTQSTDFPVTGGAVQSTSGGGYDVFVAEFDPTLSKLLYSTYLGGSGNEFGLASRNLALDKQSPPSVYVTGYTNSTDFPITSGTYQATSHGGNDAFVTQLSAASSGAAVQVSPASLAFGTQTIGRSSAGQSVTITNSGTVDLIISSIAVSGANSSDFQQTNSCATVFPSASCVVTVTFTPSAKGTRAATTTITDNATPPTQTVSLQGVGTVVSLSSTSLTFPSQKVGTSSQPLTVTLTNTGTTAMNVMSISVGGKNSSDFVQTNNCGTSVSAGASCTITVTFTPTATGSRSALVNINDSGGGSPQKVSLSGTGS